MWRDCLFQLGSNLFDDERSSLNGLNLKIRASWSQMPSLFDVLIMRKLCFPRCIFFLKVIHSGQLVLVPYILWESIGRSTIGFFPQIIWKLKLEFIQWNLMAVLSFRVWRFVQYFSISKTDGVRPWACLSSVLFFFRMHC